MKQYDVNKDGKVTEQDAKMVQKYLAYLLDSPELDINDDGWFDYSDYEQWNAEFENIRECDIEVKKYDQNNDGRLTDTDVKIIQEAIAKLRRKTSLMDIDKSGRVSMSDVTLLQNVIAKKRLDINKDNKIDKNDAKCLEHILIKFEKFIANMDVNKDGDINMRDVVDIQQNKD